MPHHGTIPAATRTLAASLALACAIAFAAAGPAAAGTQWDYPLLPHVKALAFFPSSPLDSQPTTVVLSSVYSLECWNAGEIRVSDSAHVEIDLSPCTLMPDSVSGWVRQASLGVLAAGAHTLSVRANVASAGGTTVEEITVPFDVAHDVAPPPAPSDTGSTLLAGAAVDPPSPTVGDRVSVTWRGLAPFTCMPVTSSRVVDPSHLEMTLQKLPGCTDTTRTWEQRFDLGVLSAGIHNVALDITVITPDSTTHLLTGVGIFVSDPNAPPSPPVDSLRTLMSATHPNPFSGSTRFSVSLQDARPAQVMVYDLGGRRVATVFSGLLPAGTSELSWDGRRADGSRAAGGIYFYRLTMPGRVVTRRVVLLATP